MNSFKEFDIPQAEKAFVGKSIEMYSLIGESIIVHDFKIERSKFADKGNGLCLTLQITFDGAKRVVFSGSRYLMEAIRKVPENGFPFETKIIKQEKRLLFS